MEGQQWEIQKYIQENGVCPFDEWFDTLDYQSQARIDVRLDRVRLGNLGDSNSVGKGVYELRFHFGAGYRVYFGIIRNQVILLLMGGDKKRQKKDIKKAQQFWNDYQQE